jgi:hypothetical protein
MNLKEQMQCMYSVTLWRIRVIIVVTETQQCVLCDVKLHFTVSNIKIFCEAQKNVLHRFIVASNNKMYLGLHVFTCF